jgi:hypothetical protein
VAPFFHEVFKHNCSNLRRIVVVNHYPGAKLAILYTNVRVLLIMQFNKALIILLPTKIATLCQGAQCISESLHSQRYSEQQESDQ